ncbi:MAG TPA: tripartite tricarboxylate transporter substrate-binding protein [Xanthobacteraceae bacterium]|nr:tripartite tricarboxylate transporter substrate-binding protein [Xanthobacteraceae bacterium]
MKRQHAAPPLLFLTALLCCPAAAQDRPDTYPSRSIRIVVPFPPGGPADIIARLIGRKMTEDWGQAVIVENRAGANTIIGAQAVAKAAPDGYTLLMAIDSTLVMNQFLYRTLPYDPFSDFAPITTVTKTVSVAAVRAADGPKSVAELIARARAAPGKLNYGAGTITAQLMGHLFHKAAGLDIVYVPFKGTTETTTGLLTGSVDLIYAATVTVTPLIESGQLRALAKLDSRAPAVLGDLPTLATAAGLPNLDDISIWLGLVAPAGTPSQITDKLARKVAQIMNNPDAIEKSQRIGSYPLTMSPAEFSAFMHKEADRWAKVLKELDLRYD